MTRKVDSRMPLGREKPKVLTCRRCAYTWASRLVRRPKKCPGCKQEKWWTDYKRPTYRGEPHEPKRHAHHA